MGNKTYPVITTYPDGQEVHWRDTTGKCARGFIMNRLPVEGYDPKQQWVTLPNRAVIWPLWSDMELYLPEDCPYCL